MKKLFYYILFLIVLSNIVFGQEGKSYVFDEHGVPQVVNVLTEAEAIAQYPRLSVANTFTGVNQQTFGGSIVAEGNISSGSNATSGVFKSFQAGGSGAYVSLETASGKSGLLRSSNGHFLYYDTSTGDTVMDAVYSTGKLLFKEENTLIATMATAAASTPALHLSGTIFTGGTGTTTTPQLLVEPTGTTSSVWSTSGTLIGANSPSGFGGNLIHLLSNNVSRFYVNSSGDAISANFYTSGVTGIIGISNDVSLRRHASNAFQMGADAASPTAQTFKGPDASGTNVVGGIMNIAAGQSTGNASPAELRLQTSEPTSSGSTAQTLTTRLTVSGTAITATLPVTLQGYTVATLPAGTIGMTAYVTDATAPTYLGTLTGGGSVVCPVFYNGSAWVSH